jgi:hypothetical protein
VSGTSARSSLGLGTANNVQHAKIGAGVAPSFVLHAQGSPGTGSPVVKVKVATAYAAARGIGVELTDNPSSTGDYFLYFEDAGGLRGSISGDGGTGIDVNLTSDAGAKAMIRDADIGDARSIVRQIREADWDPLEADSPKARRGRGFIAQELAEVYPDAVRPAHEVTLPDGTVRQVPWQIAPMRLIPVLTRALREQDAEIESLKARLTALESR